MSLPEWKGLLKWSLGHISGKKDSEEEKREPLSKDDMEFIKGALNTVHEHENEINNAIKTINTLSENEQIDNTSKEQLLGAFDTLEDHFNDHPSNASNIIKSGLLQSFINLLKSNDHDILNSTLSVSLFTRRCKYTDNIMHAIKQRIHHQQSIRFWFG